MRKRFLKAPHEEESSDSLMNLTPLIDVVFVVLITFILIAPLLKLDRIDLAPAATEKKQSSIPIQNRNCITIRVFEDDHITINSRGVTENDLLAVLISLKKNHPQEVPRLFHDKKATFGAYQIVKNAVETAGYDEMDILLKP
ncbi:biopolymer transporter ExbD [Candidatus Aerophobetes bacterium]|uniref:Biopolymer transporter ExbD n=1 Tax=Aerophobetes bacterium TaxID=2030807 RepID=A0A2A4YFA4_UNCAE|nr:MAG: biopolymer transporter ExbD [Candidatus Aerophobetes bacterium]